MVFYHLWFYLTPPVPRPCPFPDFFRQGSHARDSSSATARSSPVMLSAAKHLYAHRDRPFPIRGVYTERSECAQGFGSRGVYPERSELTLFSLVANVLATLPMNSPDERGNPLQNSKHDQLEHEAMKNIHTPIHISPPLHLLLTQMLAHLECEQSCEVWPA
jgi:hypothetical protein